MRALGPREPATQSEQLIDVHSSLPVFLLPYVTLLFVSLVLITLDRLLARKWPQARIKRTLFDKKFRDRHPVYFVLNWCYIVALWIVCYAAMYELTVRLLARTVHPFAH